MTVAELIAELQRRDPAARVVATWESVVREIEPKNVYVASNGVVVIDADQNFYRESFESGERTP